MPRPRRESTPTTLTQAELQLMQLLWSKRSATVNEVLDALPPDRPLAYTTVSTTLRILERKGFVRVAMRRRPHVYEPTLTRDEYQRRHVDTVVEDVFAGNAAQLVRQLVDTEQIADEELGEILALIEQRLGQ